ncbi:Ada metal-binding domain-containing protein [Acrocarpospora sp. B8E8]|uniref:Ada metal-binding domain-containing protein n=1 Tax=Acrocarpospora sp. B8E8 TaxID=3153572 RepID=UPI00325E7A91
MNTAKSYTLTGPNGRTFSSPVKGEWAGHHGSRIYGRLDCPAALRAVARGGYVKHRVFFADEATAIAAGYRPCGTCCKDRYAAWKAAHDRGIAGEARESGQHDYRPAQRDAAVPP